MVETEVEFTVSSIKFSKSTDSKVEKTLSIIKINGKKKPNKKGIIQTAITKKLFFPLRLENFWTDEFGV